MPQDTKEIIKFEHVDHEQVDERRQAVLRAKFKENLEKQNAESKKRSTMRETSAAEEQQTEDEVEFHMEEEKAAEIKNQVQTVKISQQQQATTASKEVAGMQRQCQSVPQREDGKQDAWNGHAQEASQAKAVPEEYGPDAACQEVRRDEQEFRTPQQQVKKMTQARARSEGRAIINENESNKTVPNEALLITTDVEKSFLERKEGGGQEAESIP